MKIVIIHSNANYLTGLRLPLMRELADLGHIVYALAPNMAEEHRATLAKWGIYGLECALDQTSLSPSRMISNVRLLTRQLKRLAPDVVLTNTIKAVCAGSLAAKFARVPRRIALVSGLGWAFTTNGSRFEWKRTLVKSAAYSLYAITLRLCAVVIVQNSDDARQLCRSKMCPKRKLHVVDGSGVDVDGYPFIEHTSGKPTFLFVGRLLLEKGLREYLDAARIVRRQLPHARFVLVGNPDSNPSSVHPGDISPYVDDGTVEWVRGITDVRPWLRDAAIFVLPSYYREGVPRSTLEAMASGLAIITTDSPGCRETVIEGVNGVLVPVRDTTALAEAMVGLARAAERVAAMGRQSRSIAEKRFDVRKINRDMCRIMGVQRVDDLAGRSRGGLASAGTARVEDAWRVPTQPVAGDQPPSDVVAVAEIGASEGEARTGTRS